MRNFTWKIRFDFFFEEGGTVWIQKNPITSKLRWISEFSVLINFGMKIFLFNLQKNNSVKIFFFNFFSKRKFQSLKMSELSTFFRRGKKRRNQKHFFKFHSQKIKKKKFFRRIIFFLFAKRVQRNFNEDAIFKS